MYRTQQSSLLLLLAVRFINLSTNLQNTVGQKSVKSLCEFVSVFTEKNQHNNV